MMMDDESNGGNSRYPNPCSNTPTHMYRPPCEYIYIYIYSKQVKGMTY